MAKPSGFTALQAARIQDTGGHLLSGSLIVTPTDANDLPLDIVAGGAGGPVVDEAEFPFASGVLDPASCWIPTSASTTNPNTSYRFTFQDASGKMLKVWTRVQVPPDLFNLDIYQPILGEEQAVIQPGPQGEAGANGAYTLTDYIAKLFVRAGYIGTAGAFHADVNWLTTNPLPLSYLAIISMSLYGNPSVATVAFYDVNGGFISGTVAGADGTLVTVMPSAPGGAVSVTFTARVNSGTVQPSVTSQTFLPALRFDSLSDVAGLLNGSVAAGAAQKIVSTLNVPALATFNGYISASDGSYHADPNWLATDIIPIAPGSVVTADLYGNSAVSAVTFYSQAGAVLALHPFQADFGYMEGAYAAPASTAGYRLSYSNPTSSYGAGTTASATQSVLTADITTAVNTATGLANGSIPIDSANKVKGVLNLTALATRAGYNTTGGVFNADVHWLSTAVLPCAPGQLFSLNLWGNSAMSVLTFYSASGATLQATPGPDGGTYVIGTVTAPATAVGYVICFAAQSQAPGSTSTASVSFSGADVSTLFNMVSAQINGISSTTVTNASVVGSVALATPYRSARKLQLLSGDIVFLYGDSRSSNDYSFYQAAMAARTGATVHLGGFSGTTVAYQAADAQLASVYSSGARLIIWLPGGNDTGSAGSVGTFSGIIAGEPVVAETDITQNFSSSTYPYFIQAISHAIRKIQAHFYNIRTRAGLTGSESEAAKNAAIAAVLEPVLAVCTDIPQQRNGSGDPYSQPANWMRKRAAIIECCARYKVHCVDTMLKVPYDMTQEPYYPGPASVGGATNMTNNQGVYYMDGLHPNQFGAEINTEIILADIGV